MKSIQVDTASASLAGLLEEACDDDLLIRLADGREFLVVAVDDFDAEIARTRANEELMRLLDERAVDTQRHSIGDVRQRLGL
jgi:hypothetical protein